MSEALARGEEVALVTITSSTGSTPQRVGAKMLVFADGRTVGTIGGGCYENDAFWKAREAIKARRPLTVKYELTDDIAIYIANKIKSNVMGTIVAKRVFSSWS